MSTYSTSTRCLTLFPYYWSNFDSQPVKMAPSFTLAELLACVAGVVDFRWDILHLRIVEVTRHQVPPTPFSASTKHLPVPDAIYAPVHTSTRNTKDRLHDWSSMSTENGSINSSET